MVSVERECYTLGSFEGQTEKALGVRRGRPSKLEGIVGPSRRDLRERVSDPRRLVPFPLKGTGARYGESDSTSRRSPGTSRSRSSSVHFLKVTIPLNETYQPASSANSASEWEPV